MRYDTIEDMMVQTAEMVRPPERLTVSQAAEKYRYINNVGSYVGPWRNDTTPYLVEPMDELSSHNYTGVIFVGPAQTGKTDQLLNYITHTAKCDPADMMVVEKSQAAARDFSKRRIERLFRHSPEVGAKLLQGRKNTNIFDIKFAAGWLLTLSWPAIGELSGKPIPRVWLTDYDRMPEDIDGEGAPFDLAKKRTTSFRRYGMTVAESSPGTSIEDPKWIQPTDRPHEAPPCKKILSLYNRGDRRRFYWRCWHCKEAFEPDFGLLEYPTCDDPMEAAEQAVMVCPKCGGIIHHDSGKDGPGKYELNIGGRWVKEGMVWMPDGTMQGKARRTDIASFWMKGVCAAFTDWKGLVYNYLKAVEDYEKTGSEEALKTTTNVDQGLPYRPKSVESEMLPEELKSRATDLGERVVPKGVRFLIATIDVQKSRFVVQVHGFGHGSNMWFVDRFDVRKSNRKDSDGDRLPINPGGFIEDWKQLLDEVQLKTYPLADDSGRVMQIKAIGCDSGGREGVTANAYNYWRWLRDDKEAPQDSSIRFQLIKGTSLPSAPRVQINYPDSDRKDRHAGARGDVPVLMIQTDLIKDQLSAALSRREEGAGRVHFPKWLPDWFYSELTAERRGNKGWENKRALRNEAWDLATYAIAIALSRVVRIETIDWDDPPSWAAEWDDNDLVSKVIGEKRFVEKEKDEYDLAKLAEDLA